MVVPVLAVVLAVPAVVLAVVVVVQVPHIAIPAIEKNERRNQN